MKVEEYELGGICPGSLLRNLIGALTGTLI